MSKHKVTAIKPSTADFSWAQKSRFVPPGKGGGDTQDTGLTPVSSQVSDLKPLLEELLRTLTVVIKPDASIIRIRPLHNQPAQPLCSVGLPPELHESVSLFDLPCESCKKTSIGKGIYAADLSSCDSRLDCQNDSCRFKSIIVAQLSKEDNSQKPLGVLTLFFNHAQQSDEKTIDTVRSFSRLISSIIALNRSSFSAKRVDLMAERQAIANEIHDSLAHTLVFARMRTSLLLESLRSGNEIMSAKYSHDIEEALEISQRNVRELITDFRCGMDPAGLLHALQTLTEQFSQRNDIELEFINRVPHLELPLEHEIQALHIVQEALANIATHSEASHARLIVDFLNHYYIFTIKDNGSGGCTFTPVEGHYGMMIMRERAQRIGGEIKVDSTPGFGTQVQLFFPEPGSNWRKINE
jgi:two-component system nitrate/nitrite sensor histidine kinase NarX